MNIPQTVTAGDTLGWTDSLADYPASTWTLKYHLRGPQSVTITASASGDDHVSSVTAAVSGGYEPGVYDWIARVNDGTSYYTVDSGKVTIAVDLATSTHDHRSFWRQVLDELEPVILGRASTDQLSLSIAGRAMTRMSWEELLKVYDRAKQTVASEDGDGAGRYFISFVQP